MGTHALPDDDPMLVPETHEENEHKVTVLELFFDLVFVFAFTQVTAAGAENPSAAGIARGMLVLAAVWWAWVGYAWLTNAIDPRRTSRAWSSSPSWPRCSWRPSRSPRRSTTTRCSSPPPTRSYVLGHVLFRLRNVHSVAWRRIAAAAACVALIPLAEARDRIRHVPA